MLTWVTGVSKVKAITVLSFRDGKLQPSGKLRLDKPLNAVIQLSSLVSRAVNSLTLVIMHPTFNLTWA